MKKKYFYIFLLILAFILGYTAGSSRKPSQNLEYVKPVFSTQYVEEALQLINGAKKSIKVVMFEAAYYPKYPDSPSNLILRAIKQKADEGIEVKLILEGGERFLGKRFQKELNEVMELFTNSNVKLKLDRKGIITHDKFLLVDDKKLLIGSTNWTYYGLQKNNESNVLIISRQIGEKFAHYFNRLWHTLEVSRDSGKIITIKGRIRSISKKISHRGKAYEIITLDNGLKIFINGHYDYKPGEFIHVTGYKKIYRGKEEIVAQKIKSLSF